MPCLPPGDLSRTVVAVVCAASTIDPVVKNEHVPNTDVAHHRNAGAELIRA
jgi:hypothetical protein